MTGGMLDHANSVTRLAGGIKVWCGKSMIVTQIKGSVTWSSYEIGITYGNRYHQLERQCFDQWTRQAVERRLVRRS